MITWVRGSPARTSNLIRSKPKYYLTVVVNSAYGGIIPLVRSDQLTPLSPHPSVPLTVIIITSSRWCSLETTACRQTNSWLRYTKTWSISWSSWRRITTSWETAFQPLHTSWKRWIHKSLTESGKNSISVLSRSLAASFSLSIAIKLQQCALWILQYCRYKRRSSTATRTSHLKGPITNLNKKQSSPRVFTITNVTCHRSGKPFLSKI